MTDHARDDFDDFEGPSGRSDGESGRGRKRAVFVDDSYDGGGYLGRDAGDDFPSPAIDDPVDDLGPAPRRSFSGDGDEDVRRVSPRGRSRPGAAAATERRKIFDDEPPIGAGGRGEPGGFDFDAARTSRKSSAAPLRDEPDERRAPPPRRRTPAARRRPAPGGPSNEAEQGGGSVWLVTVVLSLIWIGGVLAFSIGYWRMPVTPFGSLIEAFQQLQPRIQLMIGAIAIAPLAILWSAAFVARRASAVAQEGRRLAAIAARLESVGGGAPVSGGGLSDDAVDIIAERLEARIADLEARAEAQFADASALIEREREAMGGVLRDIETETARLAESAARGGGASVDPDAVAAAVAARLENVVAAAPAAAPTPHAPPPPAQPAPRAAPKPAMRRDPQPEPSDARVGGGRPSAARDAVMRAAQAAAASFGDRAEGGRSGFGGSDDFAEDRYEEDEPYAARGAISEYDDSEEAFDPEFDAELDDVEGDDLGSPAASAGDGVDWQKLVRAANFPESEEDRETLDALLEVIKDREVAQLLQSSEDVLSALADLDLFMDDMTPHHAPAERWRGYIMDGDRRDLIDLGGIRAPEAIETAMTALEDRQGFDQTVQTFMDRYESMLERLFREAPSNKLAVELADTRTGRAYMLLGRVSGRFG